VPKTFVLNVVNSPPSGTISSTGMAAVRGTLNLTARTSDPDGGAVSVFWRIVKPPTRAATLTAVSGPTTALNFVDERDIGSWQIEADIDDDEGERRTLAFTFDVPNLPPEIAINGAAGINAGETISLAASTTVDPDGGPPVVLRWDVLDVPSNASVVRQSNFQSMSGGGGPSSIMIPTTDRDIGTWRFRLTARDNEGAEVPAEITVEVRNRPPKITLDRPDTFQIAEGAAIVVTNTTPDDPDGGLVTHDWELIQAPATANELPRTAFQTGPSLSIPNARAGTWIFRLVMRDNDGRPDSRVEQRVKVLVDGPATAVVQGINRMPISAALQLRAGGSTDADSPGSGVPNRGHVTSAGSVEVSDGIVDYRWSLVGVPPEHFPRYSDGPIEYVFPSVANGFADLDLPANRLRAGSWTFELEVTDAEGRKDLTSHTIEVLEPNTPPFPILSQPRFFLTDSAGLTPATIDVSAALSFDLDNLLTSTYSAGLGITNYAWNVTNGPPTCPIVPTAPNGANATKIELFAAGSIVPQLCAGTYSIGVTVTDDDMPALSAVGSTAVVIGNCPLEVCIDYPTTANFQYVEFAENTDVIIYYHLNSAIYSNPIFARGQRVELALFHESDSTTPVYTGQFDYDVLSASLSGASVAHWHGYTNSGVRPKPGKYTIRMRATSPLLASPFSEAVQLNAVWLEVIDVSIASTSERLLALSRPSGIQDTLRLSYSVGGYFTAGPAFDEAILHIRSVRNPTVVLGSIPISAPLTGQVVWAGELSPGIRVTPGEYTAEVEVLKRGRSLGVSSRHPFVAYRVDIQVAGVSEARKQTPGAVLPIGPAAKHVTVIVEPASLTGTVSLISSGAPTNSFELKDGPTTLDTAAGATFPASAFAMPKVFQAKALKASPPTRLQVSFSPAGAAVSKTAVDFVNIIGLEADLKPACAADGTLESPGVFTALNPTTVSIGNFGELRMVMQPIGVVAQPPIGAMATEVSLEYESGSAAVAQLYEATLGTAVSLPRTWTAADFDPVTRKLKVDLLANGVSEGDVVLKLRYRADGVEMSTKRLKLRVRRDPGRAGSALPSDPFFRFQNVFSEGSPVEVTLDPARHAERAGRKARVFVVPHRTPADWANSASLLPAAIAPVDMTVGPGTAATLAKSLGVLAPGSYDIVYDFGSCPSDLATFSPDDRIDPGDLIDSLVAGGPSLVVLPNALAPGPLATTTVEYGLGAMPSTTSIMATAMAPYDGLGRNFSFRLRGRLVYPSPLPAAPARLPLVVFAHGNHTPLRVNRGMGWTTVSASITSEENYRGYTYLQEHLASHGYVTMSVDLDEMVGDSTLGYPAISLFGIRLRSHVLLKNIEEVLTNPAIAAGALTARIDGNAVYLVGHSRGGEAVVMAHDLLTSPVRRPPGLAGYAPMTIQGVISLSPMSVDTASPPPGKPYLLIYGSADGDVDGASDPIAWPFLHLDRATGPSHLIYAIGANHNFFNTSWANDDANAGTPTAVGAGLLLRPAQQDLAKAYILAFLKRYHEGSKAYGAYFTVPPDTLRPAGLPTAPGLSLTGSFRMPPGPGVFVLDDFQSQPAASTASSGATVTNNLLTLFEDVMRDVDLTTEGDSFNRFFKETRGASLGWSAAAEFRYELPVAQRDLQGATIALQMARQPQDFAEATTATPSLNFTLVMTDGAGAESRVPAGYSHLLRGTYPSRVRGTQTTKAVLETFRFPWWAFVANGRAIDLSDVRSIRIELPAGAARIGIDQVEIQR